MILTEIGNGALQELFSFELAEVIQNIKDPNTDAKKTRKITMVLTINPDEHRMVGNVEIKVSHTSAPIKGVSTSILMEKDRSGKVTVEEIGGQVPGQVGIDNIIEIGVAK